jgi:CRISPR-associated protein (TIGR02584 family)
MRDVLVALCGLTPQVVTETLWALARRTPPVHPTEIWILTTKAGRARCHETLIGPAGALARYVREYRPNPTPRCGTSQVIVLKGADGKPLDDVRSEEDHRAVGDHLAGLVSRQAAKGDVRLHVSVAGGRKTMGVLLAAAMQMYGRPDDRLYHVLVPPEFESLDDFFYPPKRPRTLTIKNGRRVRTDQALIELAEIPYVRLRGLMPSEQLSAMSGLSEAVEVAQRRLRRLLDPEKVRIEAARASVIIGDQPIRLSPAHLTIYRALARTKVHHCTHRNQPTCGDCVDCFVPFTKGTWEQTKPLLEERGGGVLLPTAKSADDAPEQFRSLVSKLNAKLDQELDVRGMVNPYRVCSTRANGETVYGLAIDKTKLAED